jgi:hypothetical protein
MMLNEVKDGEVFILAAGVVGRAQQDFLPSEVGGLEICFGEEPSADCPFLSSPPSGCWEG